MHQKLKTGLKVTSLAVLSGAVVAGGLATYTGVKWVQKAPILTKQMLTSDSSSRMYDNDNHLIWQSSYRKRQYVKYQDLPKNYINALTSVENKDFFKDSGVSAKSVIGAAVGNLMHSGVSSDGTQRGGSTITQQLIKLTAYGTGAKYQTYERKVQEMFLAKNLTKTFSKEQILEFYVNKLYEGHNVYGAQTIANYYYGKDLKELNLPKLAMIAGIGQSPAVYDLYGNNKTLALCTKRRNTVLSAMLSNHKISQKEYDDAIKVSVQDDLIPQNQQAKEVDNVTRQDQAYITSTLLQVKKLGYDYTQDGLEIHTALNQKMQDIVTDKVNNNSAYNGMEGVQTAVTITQPSSGYVMSQVGGRQLGDSLYGLNRSTQVSRSSGSGIKPLIDYGPAIQYLGWSTSYGLSDTPYTYGGTNIPLTNFDMGYMGNMTMKQALALSRNVPAARALDAVGGARASTFLDKLNLPNKGDKTGGSDAIGIEASTAQMAAAYGAVANGGQMNTQRYVTKIVTPDGKEQQTPNHQVQAMSPGTAYSLISMMKQVFQKGYTGQNAEIPGLAQAGKTGTVGYDAGLHMPLGAVSDSWVNGIVKGASISMWTGFDEPNKHYIPASLETNDQFVYKDIMSGIRDMVDTSDWAPTGVTDLGNGYFQKVDSKVTTTGSVPVINQYNNTNSLLNNLRSASLQADYSGDDSTKKKAALNAKQVKTDKWVIPQVPSSSSSDDKNPAQASSRATDVTRVDGGQ